VLHIRQGDYDTIIHDEQFFTCMYCIIDQRTKLKSDEPSSAKRPKVESKGSYSANTVTHPTKLTDCILHVHCLRVMFLQCIVCIHRP